METKILAFHLPQFHTFPENDEWWGTGFTEWTNTRNSKKLYAGHNQPREPLNDFYYDLSKPEDIAWEMDLAKQYGIDGFCFYHYWFNGKLLLEKPIKLMKDLDNRLPYCFCWANEPWIRSWEGSKAVLIEQTYGGENDWQAHFQWFLPYFHDIQYIKKGNKPVLALYGTKNIAQCNEMILYWDRLCKQEGFDGIYVLEEKTGFQDALYCEASSGYLEFEPLYTLKYQRSILQKLRDKIVRSLFNLIHNTDCLMYSYDQVWKNILRREHEQIDEKDVCLGGFVDWDNTARKRKNSTWFYGATPGKFKKYLGGQLKNASKLEAPFIFLNAWNEWGEGTYLEPDKKSEFKYIEKIKELRTKEKVNVNED